MTFEANNSWKQKMHCWHVLCLISCFKYFGAQGYYLTAFFPFTYYMAGCSDIAFYVYILFQEENVTHVQYNHLL